VERREALPCALFPEGKHAAACYCAPFGAPLPLYKRGGKLKAHLARRRENADPWLFEIRIGSSRRAGALRCVREGYPRVSVPIMSG
jgi:hypothetical protein